MSGGRRANGRGADTAHYAVETQSSLLRQSTSVDVLTTVHGKITLKVTSTLLAISRKPPELLPINNTLLIITSVLSAHFRAHRIQN